MFVAFTIAGTSFLFLVILFIVTSLEERAGHRFLLTNFRKRLDSVVVYCATLTQRLFVYITRYVITLSWYYSLHAFLRLLLKFLAGVYYMVEKLLHSNRDRARKIRQERKRGGVSSHLEQLTDHKDDTKLTEAQKKRLKEKSLAGK